MRLAPFGMLALGLGLLAACGGGRPVDPVPRPVERPARQAPAPAPPPEPVIEPADRAELRDYYRRIENGLVAQGLLRQDGGGPDTPYDAERLAETFVRVALYQEYDTSSGRLVQRETPSRLHRWEGPIRIETRFGPSVTDAVKARDRNEIVALANRLGRASGHPVSVVPENGNFTVFTLHEDERLALGPELRRLVPGLSNAALSSVVAMPRSSYCVVFALDPSDTGRYTRAIAIVRAEHPDLLRLSCLHEEISQGMGLPNDWSAARPSIFNDDEEFALLTNMDEQMLEILYDPRLAPGMTVETAAPIVDTIAAEIMGGPS
ncbi:DUF2927 domain-containing protein [Palleronia sp. LCG004]|uniref:DUF2927 domain-containing protein n=1 Tax=Palleronia sp. LCG004 TaxID=3079304 RepID=UPI00294256E9|nr:DUF2927 domain-containing protein [Palleronia sp. LCG004]WOI55613.1 DUF2927 domain-containing protein [Palleronia sp. LCG004]